MLGKGSLKRQPKAAIGFITPSSVEVVFEHLIENNYNPPPRSCKYNEESA